MEKQLGWACKLGGVESLEISKVGQTVLVSQVDGILDTAPVCWLCGGDGPEKGHWPLIALMPDISASPCMPLVSLKRTLQCWSSEGVSLSRQV